MASLLDRWILRCPAREIYSNENTKVSLDGIVEYKSLPSGLHNVQEDLVYFFHNQYAGISAFEKRLAGEEERNARFVAVGAMLPLKDGRLGRAWAHAANLTSMARSLIEQDANVDTLEKYWDQHKMDAAEADDSESQPLSPAVISPRKKRTLSTFTLGVDERQTLPAYHPALSLRKYVGVFGPLIYPLHRAALLRKRILIVTTAPIRDACEFVATSTPLSLANTLVLPSEHLVRLRPFFAIGVHDIPFLQKLADIHCKTSGTQVSNDDDAKCSQFGWIACTTDEILAMKSGLFDIVVRLPSNFSNGGTRKRPTIRSSDGKTRIKASQRDLRRWVKLQALLRILEKKDEIYVKASGQDYDEDDPLLPSASSLLVHSDDGGDDDSPDELGVTESIGWSELAYSSFVWWASAGEKNGIARDEQNQDHFILADLIDLAQEYDEQARYHEPDQSRNNSTNDQDHASNSADTDRTLATAQDARIEMALISYFHKITHQLFEAASNFLADDEDGESSNEASILDEDGLPRIDRNQLRAMGLDAWRSADYAFIRQFIQLWYNRQVDVRRFRVECCGMKIC